MEGLDFGTMLDEDQMDSLFAPEDDTEDKGNDTTSEETKEDKEQENKNEDNTVETNPDTLFSGESESVGSKTDKDNEEDAFSAEDGTSPDFFSSIANAFAEEGIFPDLDEETIKGIKSAKDFREAIDAQIKAGLDEQQKRVAEALSNDVEPSKIRQYENVLGYLDSLKESDLNDEGEQGELLRKRILFQDYVNRGFSKERAEKAVNRAIENGTDVEDALEALESNKTFFQAEYSKLLKEAKQAKEDAEQEYKEKAERVKKSILEKDIEFFGGMEINSKVRKEAYDAIAKPIYRDPKTGEVYTALQKMELDDGEEFLAKLGLIYALTDGFKNLDGLVKRKVNKEVKKGFLDLENKINSTRRDTRGNIKFASGVDDTESILGKGMKLDI